MAAKKLREHPSSVKMYELAERVYMMHRALGHKSKVNMGEPRVCVESDNLCGTPCCFAGWYIFFSQHTWDEALVDEIIGYEDGVDEINRFLNIESLELWATGNISLWGNGFGGSAFCSEKAFGRCDSDKLNLNHISKHLYKVADRLYKAEQEGDL